MLPRALVRRVIHPLHERLRGRPTYRFMRMYAAHDRLSAAELQARHDELLVKLLRHAATEVPFYRERVDAVQGVADLACFPVLDKAVVRAAGSALKAAGFRGKLIPLATGGSSGEPLRFFSDQQREASQLAAKARARAWFGVHQGMRETDLWGSPIEAAAYSGLRRLAASALGWRLLPAFQLNPETMAGFRAVLGGGKTDLLYGYASSLARYARFLAERGERFSPGELKLVVSTAEVLLPADRAVIEDRLAAPLANEFGCRDGGLIAHGCPRGQLHLMHDAVHVELLDVEGRAVPHGSEGEVVVTNLHARGYPLVRYRTGDRAAFGTGCACGLPHPVLASVAGRMTDSVRRRDGTRVHGLALIYMLRDVPGVRRFRCIQRADLSLDVAVELEGSSAREELLTQLAAGIATVLGPDLALRVAFVSEFEPLPSGKHRYIVCEATDDLPTRS